MTSFYTHPGTCLRANIEAVCTNTSSAGTNTLGKVRRDIMRASAGVVSLWPIVDSVVGRHADPLPDLSNVARAMPQVSPDGQSVWRQQGERGLVRPVIDMALQTTASAACALYMGACALPLTLVAAPIAPLLGIATSNTCMRAQKVSEDRFAHLLGSASVGISHVVGQILAAGSAIGLGCAASAAALAAAFVGTVWHGLRDGFMGLVHAVQGAFNKQVEIVVEHKLDDAGVPPAAPGAGASSSMQKVPPMTIGKDPVEAERYRASLRDKAGPTPAAALPAVIVPQPLPKSGLTSQTVTA